MHHLIELRYRLLYVLTGYLIAVITAFLFSEELLYIISKPLLSIEESLIKNSLEERRLIYTNITEAFTTQLTLAAYLGLYIILPNVIYQIWSFIRPGLYQNEQNFLRKIIVPSVLLFLLGLFLTFNILTPAICKFFLGFETTLEEGAIQIQLEAKISEYVSTILNTIFIITVLSQYPLLILILLYLGIIDFDWLVKQRKLFIFVFFIIGAICTPPDVLSQIVLAIVLSILYEGLLIILLLYNNYTNLLQQYYSV